MKIYLRSLVEWALDIIDAGVCGVSNQTAVPDPDPPLVATQTYRGPSLREVIVKGATPLTPRADIMNAAVAAAGVTFPNIWESRIVPSVEGLSVDGLMVRIWTD